MAFEWTDLIAPSVGAFLGAAFGYGGGRLALWQDKRAAEKARSAEWMIEHHSRRIWHLVNSGSAGATEIHVQLSDALYMQSSLSSDLLTEFHVESLAPGENQPFMLQCVHATATAVVTWTDRRGERRTSNRIPIPPKLA